MDSRSEVVVPILALDKEGDEKAVGVIDVDCKAETGFDEVDLDWLIKVAELIGRSCDWEGVFVGAS